MRAGPLKNGSGLDASSLRRSASVVRKRRDVDNALHFETRSLERSNRRLATTAGSANLDIDLLHSVLLSATACLFRRDLRGERRTLSRTLEVRRACRSSRDRVALRVGDRHQGVVERSVNVRHAQRDVLDDLCLSFACSLSCHVLITSSPSSCRQRSSAYPFEFARCGECSGLASEDRVDGGLRDSS